MKPNTTKKHPDWTLTIPALLILTTLIFLYTLWQGIQTKPTLNPPPPTPTQTP